MTAIVTKLDRAPGIEDPGRVSGAGTERPDPEVSERARRRTFTPQHKQFKSYRKFSSARITRITECVIAEARDPLDVHTDTQTPGGAQLTSLRRTVNQGPSRVRTAEELVRLTASPKVGGAGVRHTRTANHESLPP
jgi:hypothetical protein